jgi:hypothetical protein
MIFAACLILSGVVAFLAFGWLVSIFISDDPPSDGRDDYPPDSPWPVDWEQFPE